MSSYKLIIMFDIFINKKLVLTVSSLQPLKAKRFKLLTRQSRLKNGEFIWIMILLHVHLTRKLRIHIQSLHTNLKTT